MKLYEHPSKKLTRRCKDVSTFGRSLLVTVEEMLHMMVEHDGVGLAAPQVGLNRRLFIVHPKLASPGDEVPMIYANPKFTYVSGDETKYGLEEGCLSLPGKRYHVSRPDGVVLEAQDILGETFEVEADGWYARVLQHEMDHLDGTLINMRGIEKR